MSVIAMPTRPTTANYHHLPATVQTRFDHVMEQADTTIDAGEYNALMLGAASLAGLTIPYGAEITRCACNRCYCGHIFDTTIPGLNALDGNDGYNLPRLQCPDCADDHPTHQAAA